jgi:hypothetical protein
MMYMMTNPLSNNSSLEESDDEGDLVQVWAASDMTTDDFKYLEAVADVADVSEFLTAVDCYKTNALFA